MAGAWGPYRGPADFLVVAELPLLVGAGEDQVGAQASVESGAQPLGARLHPDDLLVLGAINAVQAIAVVEAVAEVVHHEKAVTRG